MLAVSPLSPLSAGLADPRRAEPTGQGYSRGRTAGRIRNPNMTASGVVQMPSEAPRRWPFHNFHPASVSTAQTPTKTQPKTLNHDGSEPLERAAQGPEPERRHREFAVSREVDEADDCTDPEADAGRHVDHPAARVAVATRVGERPRSSPSGSGTLQVTSGGHGEAREQEQREIDARCEPHQPIGPLQPRALLGVRLTSAGRQLVADGRLEGDARRDQDEAERERDDRGDPADR